MKNKSIFVPSARLSLLFALPLVAMVVSARPSFYLPARIYVAPGLELNVYYREIFDSVVPQNYAYSCECERGKTQLHRWYWTPEAADAGREFPLVVNAWNDDGLVAAVTTRVCVAAVPAEPKRRLTLALFGDSLTNSRYQDRILQDMLAAGHENYLPVGKRKGVPLPVAKGKPLPAADHDGYGGYTCHAFLSRYVISDEEYANVQDAAEREQLKVLGTPEKIVHDWQRALLRSPLVRFRDGKRVVDVQAWLDDVNGGKAPDVVVVELGVNDIFSYKGEAPELGKRWRAAVRPSYVEFFKTLRKAMPKARFALTTQPIGTNQDGFGYNYGAKFNEVQHRKTMFMLNRELERFVAEFGDPLLELLPVAHAIDTEDSYIYRNEKVSAVSPNMVRRNCNAVHPNAEGGKQLGDAIAAWLMAKWNEL